MNCIFCSFTCGREQAQNDYDVPLEQYKVQRCLCSQKHCCLGKPDSTDASGGGENKPFSDILWASRERIQEQFKQERVQNWFVLGIENSETLLKLLLLKDIFLLQLGKGSPRCGKWVICPQAMDGIREGSMDLSRPCGPGMMMLRKAAPTRCQWLSSLGEEDRKGDCLSQANKARLSHWTLIYPPKK